MLFFFSFKDFSKSRDGKTKEAKLLKGKKSFLFLNICYKSDEKGFQICLFVSACKKCFHLCKFFFTCFRNFPLKKVDESVQILDHAHREIELTLAQTN